MRLPNQQKHHYGAKRDTWADVERESSDIKLESTKLQKKIREKKLC